MTRFALLADHDLNEAIVSGVIRREPMIDFIHARDLGLRSLPDDTILATAAQLGRIVVSHDVNTMSSAASRRIEEALPMAGLILARQSLPVGAVIEDLILIWTASEAAEWRDRVVFLPL